MCQWSKGGGLTLQVGPGRGDLFRLLPDPKVGIQLDCRFKPVLQGHIIWSDFLTYEPPWKPRRIVGNLPFANTLAFLLRAHTAYAQTRQGLYIVQKELGHRILSPSRVGLLIRWLYQCRVIHSIPGSGFSPKVRVDAVLISLTRRDRCPIQVHRLATLLRRIKTPRKMLGHFYRLNSSLARKRVDQLNPHEQESLVREILHSASCQG